MPKLLQSKFRFLPILILSILLSVNINAQIITDLIHTINLNSGTTDSLLISDIFYANNYSSLKLISNKSIDVKFNPDKSKLLFTPAESFEGMTPVSFRFGNHTYIIPVIVKKSKIIEFSFKPDKKYDKVFLFGSFNSWNRSGLEMKNENGEFKIAVPLDPGRYQYKFYADGAELINPQNPVTVPNGMGNYNSVLNVEPKHKSQPFLFVNGAEISGRGNDFSFIYQNNESHDPLNSKNVIALFNNNVIAEKDIKLDGNEIHISPGEKNLKGKNILRLAVTQNGQVSNIQNVILFDGKPAGHDKTHFSWNDAVIYSDMIDRFSDGDKSLDNPIVHDSLFKKANYMGGDFQGIINKLNEGYFDSLGINTLWLSPVYDNTNHAFRESPRPHRWFSGYHGYWPVKPRSVEEEFGNMAKLKELIKTAHKHNIKVLLDIVAHHVHQEHPYYKEHPNWFGTLKLPDGSLNLRRWDDHRLTTWFDPFLPSFDFIHSKDAVNAVTNDAVWWLKNTGADGFRQDAVKHIPNNFWRNLNLKLRKEVEIPEHKDVFQMGETFGSYDLVKSYVNNGQLPAQFNFNLYDVAVPTFLNKDASFEQLSKEIEKGLKIFGYGNMMGNIMDSQDKDRYMAYADGDLKINDGNSIEIGWNNPPHVDHLSSYQKERLYLAYLLTIPGIPTIFYGDEIGMTGAADPDNRRMMRFGSELNSNEKNNLYMVSKLIHIRDNHPALRYGDYYPLMADTNIFAYVRSDMNERVLIVLNKSEESKTVSLSLPVVYNAELISDFISGDKVKVNSNDVNIIVPGIGYRIFKITD